MRIVVALLVSASSLVYADAREQPVAIAVNAPTSWGHANAASLYWRVASHNALRANAAIYPNGPSVGEVVAGVVTHDGTETSYDGRTYDLGIGWQYFPDRVWDGLVFEVGVLHRVEHHTELRHWSDVRADRHMSGYAGRALVGSSWLAGRYFVAFAVGLAVGNYRGSETLSPTFPKDEGYVSMIPRALEEQQRVEIEGYLRLGIAFGE